MPTYAMDAAINVSVSAGCNAIIPNALSTSVVEWAIVNALMMLNSDFQCFVAKINPAKKSK